MWWRKLSRMWRFSLWRTTALRATRRETASPSLEWPAPLGRATMVTTCKFNRKPLEKTLAKSFRRRSRCSGPKRRSGNPCSGRESAPSFRTPCTENPPTRLGGHARPETVASFAFQVARLERAFHRTMTASGEAGRNRRSARGRRGRESTGACGAVSIRPAKPRSSTLRLVVPDNRYTLQSPPPPNHRDRRHDEDRNGVKRLGTLPLPP